MTITKKQLQAVITELNEKRKAKLTVGKKDLDELMEMILEATDEGEDLKKLSKTTVATIKEILALQEDEDEETDEDEDEETDEDEDEETDEDEDEDEDEEPAPKKGKSKDKKAVKSKAKAAKEDDDDDNELPEELTSREAKNIAAEDMNTALGLSPGINIKAKDKAFENMFAQAAKLVHVADKLEDFTFDVLRANGFKLKGEAKTERSKEKPGIKKPRAPKAKKEKGPGVVQTIADLAKGYKKPFTREQLHKDLCKIFPDRDAESMLSTVKLHMPNRLQVKRGYQFEITPGKNRDSSKYLFVGEGEPKAKVEKADKVDKKAKAEKQAKATKKDAVDKPVKADKKASKKNAEVTKAKTKKTDKTADKGSKKAKTSKKK